MTQDAVAASLAMDSPAVGLKASSPLGPSFVRPARPELEHRPSEANCRRFEPERARQADSIPQDRKGEVVGQAGCAVAASNCSHRNGCHSRATQLPSPVVGGIEADHLCVEVHLHAGQAGPPDRDQLTVARCPAYEARGGDQPVDVAVVPPPARDGFPTSAVCAPAPPAGPAAPRPGGFAAPYPKARRAAAPGHLARFEGHPRCSIHMGASVVLVGGKRLEQFAGRTCGDPSPRVPGAAMAPRTASEPRSAGHLLRVPPAPAPQHDDHVRCEDQADHDHGTFKAPPLRLWRAPHR